MIDQFGDLEKTNIPVLFQTFVRPLFKVSLTPSALGVALLYSAVLENLLSLSSYSFSQVGGSSGKDWRLQDFHAFNALTCPTFGTLFVELRTVPL
jgi:hypothetical protein